MSRRRAPRVGKKPWGDRTWSSPVTPPGPSQHAELEAWLAELVRTHVILDVRGAAGTYELTLPNQRRVTLSADTDQAAREEAAILGPAETREHYDTWMQEAMTTDELRRVAAHLRLFETPTDAARADSDEDARTRAGGDDA